MCSRTAIRSALDVESYIADEQRLGRLLDYAVIVPRLQALYEWSADELGEPRLLDLVRDGNPSTLALRRATRPGALHPCRSQAGSSSVTAAR